ncbi:phosphoglucosamine mutase [Gemmatimonadota bacterium]
MARSARDLMAGVSGVRGITDSGLTPSLTAEYVSAYSAHCGEGAILLARDPRSSGEELTRVVIETLTGHGRDVILLGIVPTPTLLLNTALLKAAGGIMITASHNPVEWNGLKFADPAGRFLSPIDTLAVIETVAEGRTADHTSRGIITGELSTDTEAGERHFARVREAAGVDVDRIGSAGFTAVVDGCGGAGSEILPFYLESHGVQVHRIHCDLDGSFPRPPEPVPEALADLCKAVVSHGADLGFALDPDGDRLAIVGPDGDPLGEESTLALAARQVLGVCPGRVSVNLSTSRMIDDVAREFGVPVTRTPVGEINVVEGMLADGSVIGGEGNGGVIHPDVVHARDALTGSFLILSAMAEQKLDLPALRSAIPSYAMHKMKYPLPESGTAVLMQQLAGLPDRFTDAAVDVRDGVRLDWSQRWVHIRPSNTEPVVRLISEAPRDEEALRQADEIASILDLTHA